MCTSLGYQFSDNYNAGKLLYYIGLTKKSDGFFHKIRETFFIFTNNFINLDILGI